MDVATSKRSKSSRPNDLPGPGAYEIPNNRDGVKFSIRGRPEDKKLSNIPGPSDYYTERAHLHTRERSPSYRMGHSERKIIKDDFKPGPGSYAIDSEIRSPKWGFGSESRTKEINVQIPGPGSYDLPDTKSQVGYTISGKHLSEKIPENPGPTAYDPKEDGAKLTSPKYSIPKSSKETKFVEETPGPQSYNQEIKEFTIKH